ncbi:hypothetical protein HPB48_008836 [Haemaphysalis longicornis]|uniref:Uncharacterized protein n=1 Tax=Haemaphysalis longicornis TaxID=44386 RepID=A0A9J6H5C0_HAELO|nr:hypothetical protein HPB48_008836 [Haemaphysalis longicornis]
MEVESALILFQRSWELHKLRYTTVVSDGDCRTYLALRDADVYGLIRSSERSASTTCRREWALNYATSQSRGQLALRASVVGGG